MNLGLDGQWKLPMPVRQIMCADGPRSVAIRELNAMICAPSLSDAFLLHVKMAFFLRGESHVHVRWDKTRENANNTESKIKNKK